MLREDMEIPPPFHFYFYFLWSPVPRPRSNIMVSSEWPKEPEPGGRGHLPFQQVELWAQEGGTSLPPQKEELGKPHKMIYELQRSVNLFCRGPSSKYFRLGAPHRFYHNYPSLPLYWKSNRYRNKRVCLVQIKLYFQTQAATWFWLTGCSLLASAIEE